MSVLSFLHCSSGCLSVMESEAGGDIRSHNLLSVDEFYLHEDWRILNSDTSFSHLYFVRGGAVWVFDLVLVFLSTVYRPERNQRGWPDGGATHVLAGWRPAVSAARGAVPQPGSSGRAGGNVGGPLHTVSSTARHCFLTRQSNCVPWRPSLLSLKWSAGDAQWFQGHQMLWFRTCGQDFSSLKHLSESTRSLLLICDDVTWRYYPCWSWILMLSSVFFWKLSLDQTAHHFDHMHSEETAVVSGPQWYVFKLSSAQGSQVNMQRF